MDAEERIRSRSHPRVAVIPDLVSYTLPFPRGIRYRLCNRTTHRHVTVPSIGLTAPLGFAIMGPK